MKPDSEKTDEELIEQLNEWIYAFDLRKRTFREWDEGIQADNAELFRRLQSPTVSAVLDNGTTFALACADDNGVFERWIYLTPDDVIRRDKVSGKQLDKMFATLIENLPEYLDEEENRVTAFNLVADWLESEVDESELAYAQRRLQLLANIFVYEPMDRAEQSSASSRCT